MKGIAHWIDLWNLGGNGRDDQAKTDRRLKVSNTSRQAVLANNIEVADHGPKRRKGLLGRNHLSADEGLWIIPCEAVHTFGMRFAIDLVYLDRNNRVKKTRSAVGRFRMSACLSAHSVLELAAGTIARTQTTPGDRLEFSFVEQPLEWKEAVQLA